MACPEYKVLLPLEAEGRLPPDQERLLRDHLRTCDSCRSTLRLLRMDDRAIQAALLGGIPPAGERAPRRRGLRMLLAATVVLLLVLLPLLLIYLFIIPIIYGPGGPWGP